MSDHILIAGVDEAGRGPLAGPVFAGAVILDPNFLIAGLKDSKILTPKKREELFSQIKKNALCYAVGRAEVQEIDQINIFQASLLAMKRAILGLRKKPGLVLVDGKFCPETKYDMKAIIDGDALEPAISAASIVAKVLRDEEMMIWDQKYPQYGFANHKGYGTKEHLAALKKYGPCPIHRKTFAPVRDLLSWSTH
jgi:ribonuclease HII